MDIGSRLALIAAGMLGAFGVGLYVGLVWAAERARRAALRVGRRPPVIRASSAPSWQRRLR